MPRVDSTRTLDLFLKSCCTAFTATPPSAAAGWSLLACGDLCLPAAAAPACRFFRGGWPAVPLDGASCPLRLVMPCAWPAPLIEFCLSACLLVPKWLWGLNTSGQQGSQSRWRGRRLLIASDIFFCLLLARNGSSIRRQASTGTISHRQYCTLFFTSLLQDLAPHKSALAKVDDRGMVPL